MLNLSKHGGQASPRALRQAQGNRPLPLVNVGVVTNILLPSR